MNIKLTMLIITLFLCCIAHASDASPFNIPRSTTVVIQDSETKRFYEIHIQLPKNYTEDQKYPVVYMTDSPYTFPIVTGGARFPINFNKMENLMFVGISWEIDQQPALSRQRDYTPTLTSKGFKNPSGQAEQHLAFIRNDVINYIEKNYSTEPTKRSYSGNSFGGLFGAYILLTAPETFAHYILGSPSLWWDNKYLLRQTRQLSKLSPNTQARVFIGIGEQENGRPGNTLFSMVDDAQNFYTQLSNMNIQDLELKLHIIASANHETAYPTTAIQGLWWLFGKTKTAKEQ